MTAASNGPAGHAANRTIGRLLRRPDFPTAPSQLAEPLAHRGMHAPDGPVENTLGAFVAAGDGGYSVEFDVHLSVDGVPVVFHDFEFADGRRIGAVPRNVLPSLVPTLAKVFNVLPKRPVMCELTHEGCRVGALEAGVARVLDTRTGPHCIASFHPSSVAWFARHRPGTVRVFTLTDQGNAPLPRPLRGWYASRHASPRHSAGYVRTEPRSMFADCRRWRRCGGAGRAGSSRSGRCRTQRCSRPPVHSRTDCF